MRRPTVDIYSGQREERLVDGGPRPVVPEGPVGIRVWSPRRTLVLFDDEPLAAVWSDVGETAYAQVDLTNRVGFHRVSVRFGAETIGFDFETATAKATWDDIQDVAKHEPVDPFRALPASLDGLRGGYVELRMKDGTKRTHFVGLDRIERAKRAGASNGASSCKACLRALKP